MKKSETLDESCPVSSFEGSLLKRGREGGRGNVCVWCMWVGVWGGGGGGGRESNNH